MPFGERGGYRPSEELQDQLERAETTLGGKPEHALTPPSQEVGDIFKIPLAEIKKKFARRYEIYLKLLRAQRREDEGELVLTQDDIDEMQKWLKGLNALDRYIAEHKTGETEVLRERQLPIFEDLRNFIEQGGKEGYVKLPTGVGKTVLFTELIEALDFKTLIVVPTTPLIEQTQEQIEEFAPDLEVGKVYAYAKEHGRQVTIITYDSFVSQVRDGKIQPEDYDCLILDEAHTALSTKRSDTVRQFKDALKLGFTATPAYSEKKKVGNLLPAEIHSMSIREAVEEGLLCSFSAMVARTNVDLSKVSLTSAGEYDEHQLAKAVNIASRNQSAVDLYKTTFDGETAVAYCVNIKHAEAVARTFNEQGVRAEVISGNTSRAEQKRIKKEFHEGKIKVLCNADILIPGFDEPRASVCLNLRPTRSRVIAEQRGGRVLRTQRRNPDKHAHIVDFIDQGIDDKRPPILFADVAEGAGFIPRGKRVGDGGGGGGRPPTPIVDIPGLEVITDMEEVMRIVGRYREILAKRSFLAFQDLQIEVRREGIKNKLDFEKKYKKHKGWPSRPHKFYENWPGWNSFLGKEGFLPFDQFQAQVKAAKITSIDDYKRRYKQFKGWPSNPNNTYSDRWPGWSSFLGREGYIPYDSIRDEVRSLAIQSVAQYQKEYKTGKHPRWPYNPAEIYKDAWSSWAEFLGKEVKKFLSFAELRRQVREEKIAGQEQYFDNYREHVGWPSSPNTFYKKQWRGWQEFLGTDFLPFDQLGVAVRKAQIQSGPHYDREYARHTGWPSNPDRTYVKQWPGWDDFLGREPPFLSFDLLQKQVRAANIISVDDYKRRYKQFKGWPSDPSMTYKDQWVGWKEFLGRGFPSLENLKIQVRKAKIRSSTEYVERFRDFQNWPSTPPSAYQDKWKGWDDFLGREAKEFRTFRQLQIEVRIAKIRSRDEYEKERKEHIGWHSDPSKLYKSEWPGWPEFLGKKK